jgi:ATP-dependent RNA helicase DeaD
LREILVAGELDSYRSVVESLAAEFDVMEVAAAGVKLLHDAQVEGRDAEEQDIPTVPPPSERPMRPAKPGKDARAAARPGAREDARGTKRRSDPSDNFDMARLFIGVGRRAGVRPADLVGAIAGEAGVEGKRIGAIQIGDEFSLVEVPEPMADQIITALRQTTLRGKKVPVRRDRA